MKKSSKVVLSGVALSTIGVTSYLLKEEKRKNKFISSVQMMKNKAINSINKDKQVMEKSGHPDPHDIEDNTMVAEGSMYAVNYYDEKKK